MFENCREPNDYIEEIFRLGLKENYGMMINGTDIDGYYLTIPSRNKSEVAKLRQWERLFVNIKTKSNKVYGELDNENMFSQCLLWVYEELSKVVNGDNPKFPITSTVKDLLEEKESEIAPYILTCVGLKLKTYIGSKRNPNYIISQKNGKRKFERVNFYYLDDNKEADRYNILEDINNENSTGEITEYLLEMLKNSTNLTRKQKQYLDVVLSDDHYISDSKVYNLEGEVVYNSNQYFFFNRQLCKEIAKIIKDSDCLLDKGDRVVFR